MTDQLLKCADCGKRKPKFVAITANDSTLNFCEQCWWKRRRAFIRALKSGDPRATRIYEAVLAAVQQNGKVQ